MDNLNIEDIKEENFIPFVVINPIFEEKEKIKVITILNNSSIGYLDKYNHSDFVNIN